MSATFTVEQVDRSRVLRRRITFFTLVFLLTSLATWFMADLLWRDGMTGVEWVVLVLFVILFTHIAVGFSTALLGLYVLNRAGDPYRITRSIAGEPLAALPLASTAIVMPVFNEDPSRVFEGLRVIYRSLELSGRLENFDFFILSDSNNPNNWIQEEVAWVELCKQLNGFGRIFYRKRRISINKKSGNVADFLRRWGRKYRYMAVLDADSIMTGESLIRLVAMMERNLKVGILQTAPRIVNGVTLYARLQQFSNRLYSPVFLAGLNYWHQGEGNFWGHNAVIRVAPFMEHAALPELPGVEPFGGRILSHDFVEAALLRRAGWRVWLAYDLDGSYEEGPPTLIDSAKRDRRWCQGNLQHSWLLLARGFHPVNRVHLLMGIMGYVASPLWLLFLLISSIQTFRDVVAGSYSQYHAETYLSLLGYSVRVPEALALFAFTLLLLFLPKILSVIIALKQQRATAYGGPLRLVGSALLEVALSALIAPINMMFNSRFVLNILLGQGDTWDLSTLGFTLRANVPPSQRLWPCIAYDVAHDNLVMFGGSQAGGLNTNAETWIWNGAGWSQRMPAQSPPARALAACAYDGQHVTLFGGAANGPGTELADAWSWDGTTWTPITVPASLTARMGSAAAYDPVRKKLVLTGGAVIGANGPTYYQDTYTYDGMTWRLEPTGFAPTPRWRATLTWNPARQTLILAGGASGGGLGDAIDAYEWDGTAWHTVAVSGGPENRSDHGAISSIDGGGIQVFGGSRINGASTTFDDRWELRWDSDHAHERCNGADLDGDHLDICADPDCWWVCTPLCPPGTTCDPSVPRCGDGTCDTTRESCRTCPQDCTCAPVCGDGICDPGETACPGDCP